MTQAPKIPQWIQESNLIEGINSLIEDERSFQSWNWLRKHKTLSIENILGVHKRIIPGQSWSGSWRTCDVQVGNHIAPHYPDVGNLMQFWISTHANANTEEAIKQAHIRFEGIHPFRDGNGRTGRMIMNFQRLKANLEPLLLLANERQNYYRWFEKDRAL